MLGVSAKHKVASILEFISSSPRGSIPRVKLLLVDGNTSGDHIIEYTDPLTNHHSGIWGDSHSLKQSLESNLAITFCYLSPPLPSPPSLPTV